MQLYIQCLGEKRWPRKEVTFNLTFCDLKWPSIRVLTTLSCSAALYYVETMSHRKIMNLLYTRGPYCFAFFYEVIEKMNNQLFNFFLHYLISGNPKRLKTSRINAFQFVGVKNVRPIWEHFCCVMWYLGWILFFLICGSPGQITVIKSSHILKNTFYWHMIKRSVILTLTKWVRQREVWREQFLGKKI